MTNSVRVATAVSALFLVSAVGLAQQQADVATAELRPTDGNTAQGTVRFSHGEQGVIIEADLSGLSAGSAHGFHIHENGDCSAPDATSAGGHFNPAGTPHGAPTDASHHAGDLGNVGANPEGVASTIVLDPDLEMSGRAGVIGRAVVLHAGADDLESQPSGAAGARIACGVIRAGS